MPTLEPHYIGSDLGETITVTDANGALVADALLSKVEAVVYLNNVVVEKFQWNTGGTSVGGFSALTNEAAEGSFSLKIAGDKQSNWNKGMIEIAVRRVITSGTLEETKRFQVRMAMYAGGANFS